jgi:large subunit ribosomal protein L3
MNTIFGFKKEMTHSYIGDARFPVTKVKVWPCVVTQIKTKKSDGYDAIQVGFGIKKLKLLKKPQAGHLKAVIDKEKSKAPFFLREVKTDIVVDYKIGDKIEPSLILKKGDKVSVSGTSKGKGFAGVVKRWGFAGGPKTHGQSDRLRAPGSIGQGTTPGRVWKGKKMAGRMGGETITVKNLMVIDFDEDMITLSGAIPGGRNSLVSIRKIGRGKLEELIKQEEEAVFEKVEGEENSDEAGEPKSEEIKEEKDQKNEQS